LGEKLAEQEKLPGLQIARAIAALTVAYEHSWHVTMPFPEGTSYLITFIGRLPAVPFFFAISGFVICMIAVKPNFQPLPFLVRRVFRIYPLWIVTTLVFLVLCGIALGYPERHSLGFFAYSLTLLPTEGYPFYNVGWSLQHEIAFYALATMMVPRFGLWGLSAFLCAGTIADHIFTLPWYLHQYASYYPDFLAGIAAFATSRYLRSFGFWIPFAAGVGMLIIFMASITSLAYSPAIFLLLAGFLNIRFGASIIKRTGVLLGDASYSIYLIHPLVFYFVYAMLQPPLPPVWTQEFLRFGSLAIVCAISIASWKLFETPMIRIGNRLMNRSHIPNQIYQPLEL